MTYPLVIHMADSVVGQIGDNIYFIFLIRWYEKAWLELKISPFFHPGLNYPQGWSLASTDTSLATTLFGFVPSLIAGPTFGYNFAMLLMFALSGWTMFYWVLHLTGSRAAGLISGMIYAFLPYRMAHFLIGHMNLSGTAWFPLYFMGLHALLSQRDQKNWKYIVMTALSLGLIGFTSMHYLYMTLLISVIWVAAYLLLVDSHILAESSFWKRAALTGLLAFPMVLLSMLPFIGLNSQGGLASRSVSYASMYSASPTDYLLPSTQHFLFGEWVGSHFDRSLWIEATLYIGVVALVLSVIAVLRRSQTGQVGLIKVALVVAAAAFILSLGTDFHWLGQRVEVTVPQFLQGILHRETTPVPMPSLVLFLYLPFYAKMRALMRIGFYLLILSSAVAGIGAAYVLRKAGLRRAPVISVLLLVLVFLDFYPGPYTEFSKVAARPVDYWLAGQPGQGAVIQFPFLQNEDQDQVYNTLIHGKPFVGGFFSANQPEQYLRIRPILENFPNPEGVETIKQLGVHWLLFDTRKYEDFAPVRIQVEALGFQYIDTIGDQAVFITPVD